MSESNTSHKRKRAEPDPPLEAPTAQSKRQKIKEYPTSQLPPEFWDNLSKVVLTRNALEEWTRRSRQHYKRSPPPLSNRPVTRSFLAKIRRLASEGGPDISDLRGHPGPAYRVRSWNPSRSYSRVPEGPKATSRRHGTSSTTSRKTGPYDDNFQQNLIDGGVFIHFHRFPDGRSRPKPDNLDEMKQRSKRYRASLSPSNCPDGTYEDFSRANAFARKGYQVTRSVIPILEGKIRDARCVSEKIPFTNLKPLTDGNLVPAISDVFDGARPEQLHRTVREDLDNMIIPSTQTDLPIAPNFFLAAGGDCDIPILGRRQALYNGALGERGQISLNSWNQDEPVVVNNAHTITATYYAGGLNLYSIHSARSSDHGNRPEYYMNLIRSHAVDGSAKDFRKAARSFRNLRDYAEEQRNKAIQRANDRARRIGKADAEDVVNGDLQATSSDKSISRTHVDEQEITRDNEEKFVNSEDESTSSWESTSSSQASDQPTEPPAKRLKRRHSVPVFMLAG